MGLLFVRLSIGMGLVRGLLLIIQEEGRGMLRRADWTRKLIILMRSVSEVTI